MVSGSTERGSDRTPDPGNPDRRNGSERPNQTTGSEDPHPAQARPERPNGSEEREPRHGSESSRRTSGSEDASRLEGPGNAPINRQLPRLDDLYREVVIDHYRHPRGRKELADADVSAEGYNPTCGDQARVALAVEGDRIKDIQVECHGCSISVASGSMMAELLVGKSRSEVAQLTESFKSVMHGREPEPGLDLGDLEALEGVRQFPVRIKCALLAWTTLQEALASFADKTDQGDEMAPKDAKETDAAGTNASETSETGTAGGKENG